MTPKLITSQAYTRHVLRAIQLAQKRVYVLALIIQQDEDAAHILTALIRAAHRGVDVNVIADFSTIAYAEGHLNPYYGFIDQVRTGRDMANRLHAAGARFTWVGQRSPFLFAGRTHSKWIITDDSVYCFGGINLHTRFTNEADFMFVQRDKTLARILVEEHHAILDAESRDTASISRAINHELGTLLIDGGIPFDSIIYRRAVRLVRSSRDVLMATQYCPTGRLASALKQTNFKVFYNAPKTADLFTDLLIATSQKVTNIPNLYNRTPYIHAKFLIATDEHGSKTAITGSHNFISYGGMLGTREIALMTQDKAIIESLEDFFERYIA